MLKVNYCALPFHITTLLCFNLGFFTNTETSQFHLKFSVLLLSTVQCTFRKYIHSDSASQSFGGKLVFPDKYFR
jgi:hypothetical protein